MAASDLAASQAFTPGPLPTPGITSVGMPRFSGHAARRGATRGLARSVRQRPDGLMWMLVLMHLTYAWRLPSLVTPLKPLRLAIVTAVITVGLFMVNRNRQRRLADVPRLPLQYMTMLLVCMIFSVPAGIYPSNSALYIGHTVIPMMLFAVIFATAVRSLADLEWFAAINMVAAAGYCIFILLAYRVGRSGRLEELIYYDTNDFALLLVATMPFAAYFGARGQRTGRRLLAAVCLPLYLLLLVLTGSRGGFVGLVVVTAYFMLSYRGIRPAARVGVVGLLAFGLIGLGGTTYFSKIETLLNPTDDYNWRGKSPTGRLEIWKRGIGYLSDRPVFGVGVNNFLRAEGKLSTIGKEMESRGRPFKWSVAHNSYLETATETGVVSLFCFLGLFASTLACLRRVTRAMSRLGYVAKELALAQVLIASIIGYLVCAFFISAEYFEYPYVLIGMALGLAKLALRPAPPIA